MIVAPLVSRELLRESRTRLHFAGRALLVAALGATVIVAGAALHGHPPVPGFNLSRRGRLC